jgi:hypothetical protein
MEDVLDLYAEPYDRQRPKVNFDKTSKQLIKETRAELPARPGQPPRFDYEYERQGTRNLFLFTESQAGWRHINVTEQRTMQDFAHQMKWLVDEAYPQAEVIRVVMDNLNTHKAASLYEAFAPEEARRIIKHLEFHYTPKHGSWLNMAEIELSVLQRQCLDRRMADERTLVHEIATWEKERNEKQATIDWRFSVNLPRREDTLLSPLSLTLLVEISLHTPPEPDKLLPSVFGCDCRTPRCSRIAYPAPLASWRSARDEPFQTSRRQKSFPPQRYPNSCLCDSCSAGNSTPQAAL